MTTASSEDLSFGHLPFDQRQNPAGFPETAEQRHEIIQRHLSKLGRHDWSLWSLALTVIICLTGAVASLSLSIVSEPSEPFYEFHISQSVRGLVGLVLLFSFYTLYQQLQLRRTRGRLAEQIEIAAKQQIRAEEFLKLAMLDPLTGLHNRRYAQERLASEVARSQRYGSSLTVLLLDLDDFKQLNDRYGHAAGDAALKLFGERISKAIRGSDLAVRIGGDEFLVLLPECDPSQVRRVIDRLSRLEIELAAEKIPFAFSAGWAEYQTGETSDQLLERADQKLYAEKQTRKTALYLGRVTHVT